MLGNQVAGKERSDVDRDARKVHAWLMNDASVLQMFISAVSEGACFFVGHVHMKCGRSAVRHHLEDQTSRVGLTADEFVTFAQGCLCD